MAKTFGELNPMAATEVSGEDLIPIQDISKPKTRSIEFEQLMAAVLSSTYPIGSLYVNKIDPRNPADYFGFGTWVAVKGRTVVGYDDTQPEFNTPAGVGGQKTTRHAFMEWGLNSSNFQDPGANYVASVTTDMNAWLQGDGSSAISHIVNVRNIGGTIRTQGGNAIEVRHGRYTAPNLQPYQVAYVWERTA